MSEPVEALLQAVKGGRMEDVRRLLAGHPPLVAARSDSGETPVMAALYRGHREIVDALVAAGAPLDLFAAAALGRMRDLDAALAADPGAVNAVAYDGWTALHLAAFFGQIAALERLLAAGADIAAVSQNSLRNTPLHAAVAGGHALGAMLLIERNAPIDVPDAGGHTPLHIAAEAGYASVVRALLAKGANPHAVDAEDKTPLARAAARNHNEIIDLINLKPEA